MTQKNKRYLFCRDKSRLVQNSEKILNKDRQNLKKIAYIEIDTHAEIALNFMELMNDSKAFSVDYYFSEKILKFLGFAQNDKLPENIKKDWY